MELYGSYGQLLHNIPAKFFELVDFVVLHYVWSERESSLDIFRIVEELQIAYKVGKGKHQLLYFPVQDRQCQTAQEFSKRSALEAQSNLKHM